MIKVSVMYPHKPGAKFNHAYDRDTHMPLVKERMGGKLKYYTIDRGSGGGTPNSPPVYVAAGHLICESVADFQEGFNPHMKEIMGDIPNYTDIQPLIQISDVVVERS